MRTYFLHLKRYLPLITALVKTIRKPIPVRYTHHYNDVIMSAMVFQITSLTIVYWAIYSGADQRKHLSPASLAFVRNSPVTGEFPAQRASNAENVSIWWRHHDIRDPIVIITLLADVLTLGIPRQAVTCLLSSNKNFHNSIIIIWAPSQYKDRLIYVWRFPC